MEDLHKHDQSVLVTLLREIQSQLIHIANQSDLIDQENYQESAQLIQNQSQEVLRTIDNIIASSQNKPVSSISFDIRASINQALKELDGQLTERQQNVIIRSRRQVANVAADPLLTHHILYNLIDNASRTSSDESAIRISIRVSENYISVLIRDEGVQLAKRDLDRAVRQLGKITQPIPQQPSNSGLRLFVARQLARKLSGSVNYAPAREGNCIILTLPTNEQLRLF